MSAKLNDLDNQEYYDLDLYYCKEALFNCNNCYLAKTYPTMLGCCTKKDIYARNKLNSFKFNLVKENFKPEDCFNFNFNVKHNTLPLIINCLKFFKFLKENNMLLRN